MSKNKVKVVVGLDFGTSRSGFAYSFLDDKLDNFGVVNKWEGSNQQYPKTATLILYKVNEEGIQEPIKFGWEAQKHYHTLLNQSRKKDSTTKVTEKELTLFSNFKMYLYNDTDLKYTDGVEASATEIIADYLRFMKEKVLAEINRNSTKENKIRITVDDIRWCLTVPAIWKDKQKILMREASFLAGLISDKKEGQDRFMFSYEPEAAAIYCHFNMKSKSKESGNLEVGDKFIIFDAGGGTLDLTAHSIENDGTLKELSIGKGGTFGSMNIDDSFLDHLREVLGDSAYDEIEKNDEEFQKILTRFQTLKETPMGDPDIYCDTIEYTPKVYKIIKSKNPDIELDEDAPTLYLSYDDMKKIFKPTLDGIENQLNRFISTLEKRSIKCSKILMVGGFSSSQLLQDMVKKTYQDKYQIIIPDYPGECVVKGALIFGKKPELIQTRIMRRTYGIGGYFVFDKSKHKPEKKEIANNGQELCKDIFDVWVRAGDEISSKGKTIQKTYKVVEQNQTTMKITVYSTEMEYPLYIDEDPETEVDLTFSMDFKDISRGKDRALTLEITFGTTEVVIKAKTDSEPVVVKFRLEDEKSQKKKLEKIDME